MKNLFLKSLFFATLLLIIGCQEDDYSFGDITAPTNLTINFDIEGQSAEFPDGDGSGLVTFNATAENAISYKFIFSDGTNFLTTSGTYLKRFSQNGVFSYDVTVIANGRGGVASTRTVSLTVFSDFSDDDAVQFLTAGASKSWYFAANEAAHLGVGPNTNDAANNYFPLWYGAAPFEKSGSPDSVCLYENEMVFSLVDGQLKFEQNNNGRTFFNVAFQSVTGGTAGEDFCYDYQTGGQKTVSLSPSNSFVVQNGIPNQARGTQMDFSDSGFMGYYIGQSTYEILSITENRMVVRAVAGNDAGLAWYQTLTTVPYAEQLSGGGGNNDDFTNLVWADEFDVDGAPNPANWSYDMGTGTDGWGNQEAQFYRDISENVQVTNGNLVITARAETFGGRDYTSARIKTENKFEFTYGKVEVRAKLPAGSGTWPAIWLLGANYDQQGFTWPACGEIDIMEHKGNEQNVIHGTLHYPGNSAGNANGSTVNVPNVSTEFKVYSVIWSESTIRFFVDGQLFKTFANSTTVPFNHDFFMILNVAMGGTFGGNIAPGFSQSAMEIDYVRVYQ
jgi:beta-glucanase (GH16 family)